MLWAWDWFSLSESRRRGVGESWGSRERGEGERREWKR